jgi:hypothetical protein
MSKKEEISGLTRKGKEKKPVNAHQTLLETCERRKTKCRPLIRLRLASRLARKAIPLCNMSDLILEL